MKKFKFLLLVTCVVVMALALGVFAGASESVTAETYEDMYVGEYTSLDTNSEGNPYTGEAYIVFGKVTGTDEAGIILERYSLDDVEYQNLIESKYFKTRDGRIMASGEFAVALYNVLNGNYKVRVVANYSTVPVYGEYIEFNKGASDKSITREQWENAFSLENVTIKAYAVQDGVRQYMMSYLLDGDNAVIDMGDTQMPVTGYADNFRQLYGFAPCYDTAIEYQPGRFYIPTYDVFGDGENVYHDVYLAIEDGKAVYFSATTDGEKGYIEYADYGTTVLPDINNLPITSDEWAEIFDDSALQNVTITAATPDFVENIYDANGLEKITVEGYPNVELYSIDGVWYRYLVEEDSYSQITMGDSEYVFTTMKDNFANLFSSLSDAYAMMQYDEVEDIYYYSEETFFMGAKIVDGVVVEIQNGYVLDEEEYYNIYTLSNYGATQITVPFDPYHVCEYNQQVPSEDAFMADATCQAPAKYYLSCECGEISTSNADVFYYGDTLPHDHSIELVRDDALVNVADCNNPATYYLSCACGHISNSETFTVGGALGHSYQIVDETDATCDTPATVTYECHCGDHYTEQTHSALGHKIEIEERQLSDCEYILVEVCKRDGCSYEQEGDFVYHHSYVATITTPATCVSVGEKTLTCSKCGDVDYEPIPSDATGHDWQKGSVVDGKRTDTCNHCGTTKEVTVYESNSTTSTNANDLKGAEIELKVDESINASIKLDDGVIDTIGDKDVTVSASKLSDEQIADLKIDADKLNQVKGNIYNFTISDGTSNVGQFGEENFVTITLPYVLDDGEDVDSIAVWFINDNGELESIKATYNNGYVTFKTNHFSYYTVTELTPAERCALHGHNWVTTHVVGSCTTDGYDRRICVRCHKDEIINLVEAKGHAYSEHTTPATCVTDGYTVYQCDNCDHEYTVTIKSLGHDYEISEEVQSTCEINGYITYSCTRDDCGASYTVTFDKLPHSYSITVVDATCTEDGYTMHDCEECDYYYIDNYVAPIGHDYVYLEWNWLDDYTSASIVFVCNNDDAHVEVVNASIKVDVFNGTCSDFTKTTYLATAVFGGKTYTDTKEVVVGVPGHVFGEQLEYDEDEHWYECICGEKENVNKHAFDNVVSEIAPTCGDSGEIVYQCVCGATYTEIVPATGEHDFVDGECIVCGAVDVDDYYINLVNSWDSVDGITVRINDFKFKTEVYQVPGMINNGQNITVTADCIELSLWLDEGELCGSAHGRAFADFENDGDVDDVANIYLVIYEGNLHMSVKDDQGKAIYAVKEDLSQIGLDEYFAEDGIVSVITDIMDTIISNNSEVVNDILGGIFNAIFDFEQLEDGDVIANLSWDKIYALNDNLANMTVAQFVDYYFGEGAFESLVQFATTLIDLKLSDVPQFITDAGLDYDTIIQFANAYMATIQQGIDLDAIFKSEEAKQMTLGMMIFEIPDESYKTAFEQYVIDPLYQVSFYTLIGENAQKAKLDIDDLLDMLCDKISISIETDREGMLKNLKVDLGEMVIPSNQITTTISGEINLFTNQIIETTWDTIVDEIDNMIAMPSDDMKEEASISEYPASGMLAFRGEYFEYENAQRVTYSKPVYDRVLGVTLSPNYCGDWTQITMVVGQEVYDFILATTGFETGMPRMFIIDNVNGDIVEIVMISETSCKVINVLGVEKVMNLDPSLMSGAEGTIELCKQAFGIDETSISNYGYNLYYYYNAVSNEYSKDTPHNFVQEIIMPEGGTCFDEYEVKITCTTCGDSYSHKQSGHNVEVYNEIDVSEYGICGLKFVYGGTCTICNEFIYDRIEVHCSFQEVGVTEDGYQAKVCYDCGTVLLSKSTKGEKDENCNYTYHDELIYLTQEGSELFRVEYAGISQRHNYEYDYEMYGDTCDEGVYIRQTCSDCDYYNDWEVYHHESLEVFNLNNYDCCGEHILYVHVCPCGQYQNINVSGMEYIQQEDGYSYECSKCGLIAQEHTQESVDGCIITSTTKFAISIDGEEVYGNTKVSVVEDHDYDEVTASNLGSSILVTSTCSKCDDSKQSVVQFAQMLYHDDGYYYDYEVTPSESGYYYIASLSDRDTVVELYIFKDGGLEYIDGNDDSYGNNQFYLKEYLEAGETYLYCIHYLSDEQGTIPFIFAKDDTNIDSQCKHQERKSVSILLGSDSCTEGVVDVVVCLACGQVRNCDISYEHEQTAVERVELGENGACYGYIEYYACACGELQSKYAYTCGNYTENDYIDDHGKLIHVDAYACGCGMRYESSYYTVIDRDNCTKTYYYSDVVTISSTGYIYTKDYVVVEEYHDYDITTTLRGGPNASCDNGADVTYNCTVCGHQYTEYVDWHKTFAKETIDLTNSSECGGSAIVEVCACGESVRLNIENCLCEFDHRSEYVFVEGAIDTCQYQLNGSVGLNNDGGMYVCAVTDPVNCGYTIRYATYWLKVDDECYAERYAVYQFGYDVSDGTFDSEYIYKTGHKHAWHDYQYSEEGNTFKYECVDCGSYYSETNIYVDDGHTQEVESVNNLDDGNAKYYKHIVETINNTHNYREEWIYADGTEYWEENGRVEQDYVGTFGENGREIIEYNTNSMGRNSRQESAYVYYNNRYCQVYSYSLENDYWSRYDYTYDFENGCKKNVSYIDAYGNTDSYVEDFCEQGEYVTITEPTCTQNGISSSKCSTCGKNFGQSVSLAHGHNWAPIDDNYSYYYCTYCGLGNENGADGEVILEDLTDLYGEGVNYVAGYNTHSDVQFTYYISLVLADDSLVDVMGVEIVPVDGLRAYAFSKSAVDKWAESNGYSNYRVRFSFVPFGSDGSYDYGITFDNGIIPEVIMGNTDFVDYVDYGETKSYIITPNSDGVWTISSFAIGLDTYATLYDSEGNELIADDDSGNGWNFSIKYELKAGETYTLDAKWLSADDCGDMRLIFMVA